MEINRNFNFYGNGIIFASVVQLVVTINFNACQTPNILHKLRM